MNETLPEKVQADSYILDDHVRAILHKLATAADETRTQAERFAAMLDVRKLINAKHTPTVPSDTSPPK